MDTSAVVSVALGEPSADRITRLLLDDHLPKLSAATLLEINAVLMRRLRPEDQRRVEQLMGLWGIEVVAFDAEQARVAAEAYRDYGRGSGHPATLNFGDCFSYALARVSGEPLLYVGDDFVRTDISGPATH